MSDREKVLEMRAKFEASLSAPIDFGLEDLEKAKRMLAELRSGKEADGP